MSSLEVASPGILAQLVERAEQLYSLPAVALRVMELTSQPQVDARALKDCLEHDPALASKLLRTVNSSLFGLSRQVGDLQQAIALLGAKPLKLLVLGFSLPKELTGGLEAQALSRYWRHTVIKAVACRELAERVWRIEGDEPFLAGLLQDLGQLILLQQLGDSYLRFLERVAEEQGDLAECELVTLGFDHVVLSARVLDRWQLPAPLVQAVGRTLAVDRIAALPPAEQTLPQILHLAELIARLLTLPRSNALAELLAAGARYRGLDLEAIRELVNVLEHKVAQLAEVFSLYLPAGPSYAEIVARAHQRLAEVAAAASLELLTTRPESRLLQEMESLKRDLGHASAAFAIRPPAATRRAEQQTDRPLAREPRAKEGGASPAAENDAGLLGQLAAAIAACRQRRVPLSLVLVEIDRFADALLAWGPSRAEARLHKLQQLLAAAAPSAPVVRLAESQFALLWEGCDRRDAVERMRQVLNAARHGEDGPLTLSAGLATLALPSKNFPPRELLEPAQRCLTAALASGGDGWKSIEV